LRRSQPQLTTATTQPMKYTQHNPSAGISICHGSCLCLSACLSVCLSVCLYECLSVCLPVCLSLDLLAEENPSKSRYLCVGSRGRGCKQRYRLPRNHPQGASRAASPCPACTTRDRRRNAGECPSPSKLSPSLVQMFPVWRRDTCHRAGRANTMRIVYSNVKIR